jgi:hypothetical protein
LEPQSHASCYIQVSITQQLGLSLRCFNIINGKEGYQTNVVNVYVNGMQIAIHAPVSLNLHYHNAYVFNYTYMAIM